MTTLKIDEIDPSIYGKTSVFHVSGITLALNEQLRETTIEVMKKFKEGGAVISFDINYRASLWDEETARKTVTSVFPYVDILLCPRKLQEECFRKRELLRK